jgi:hypothetical protein
VTWESPRFLKDKEIQVMREGASRVFGVSPEGILVSISEQ